MNHKLMLELADYIEEHVKWHEFDMSTYHSFSVEKTPSEKNICRTAGCIAGWSWIKEHEDVVDKAFDDCVSNDNKSNGVTSSWELLKPVEIWANQQDGQYPLAPARQFAEEHLELNADEAKQLFMLEPTGDNVWEKYRDELMIDIECDDYCPEGCSSIEHDIVFQHVDREMAVEMLRRLAYRQWTFTPSFDYV